jgi:hypothetical protein
MVRYWVLTIGGINMILFFSILTGMILLAGAITCFQKDDAADFHVHVFASCTNAIVVILSMT